MSEKENYEAVLCSMLEKSGIIGRKDDKIDYIRNVLMLKLNIGDAMFIE